MNQFSNFETQSRWWRLESSCRFLLNGLLGGVVLLLCSALVYAQPHSMDVKIDAAAEAVETPVALATGQTPSAAFDQQGRLWLAWVHGEHVYVNFSDDWGDSFSPPVMVNPQPEAIHHNGEARPKIVVDGEGRVYVAYTQKLVKRFTGHIRFSRSLDGGSSFSPPLTVNDDLDIISHRFVSMVLDSRGRLHLTWLDGRDFAAAKKQGEAYIGSALYYAVSDNHGKSFQPNIKLADSTCQCCRIAMSLDKAQQPVVFWRHIFANSAASGSRDHALLVVDESGQAGAVQRISHENWQVESCPHHGPALAITSGGRYHMAWFNLSDGQPGLYYAYADDQGTRLSIAYPFAGGEEQAQHPHLFALDGRVYLVWKSFDGERSRIKLITSSDGGESWDAAITLASTRNAADYPLLLAHQGEPYLSWHSADEGYRLIAIKAALRQ